MCVLYYRRRFYYYYSFVIVLFYSLGTRYCTTCVQGNKECCVEDCKDARHSPERDCRYCKHHRDKNTRCRHCNRGLPDGNETNYCSICYECQVIDCKEPRNPYGIFYCMHHSDPKTRCRNCKRQGLADGSETQLCSTCNLLCRTKNCNQAFVGDAKRIIIPKKECYGCKKELADGDTQYYCSTCSFVFYKIYYYYYYYYLLLNLN